MVGAINDYYLSKLNEAKNEIGEWEEEKILEFDMKEFFEYFFRKIKLPLIQIDNRKPFKTKKVKMIRVVNDEGDLTLQRGYYVRAVIPVKHEERIAEALEKETVLENSTICASQFSFLCLGKWHYKKGLVEFSCWSQDEVEKIIKAFTSFNERRNRKIESWNNSFKIYLIDYIGDLRKAIIQERKQKSKRKKRFQEDNGWGFDDTDNENSPNDDRSDSLNPNNPAYQASRDNRSNQLNPNNPRYQGK